MDGSKTFEVRKNDRAYQSGDTVILKEFNPDPISPTSTSPVGYTDKPALTFTIGFIYILDSDQIIFSLLPQKKMKKNG